MLGSTTKIRRMSIHTDYSKNVTLAILKSCVPSETAHLVSSIIGLERVNLNNLQLTTISGLDMCSRLRVADLSGNMLTSFEADILALIPSIETLNVSRNAIQSITGLSALPKEMQIRVLNISSNPINLTAEAARCLPPSLSILCLDAEQAYTLLADSKLRDDASSVSVDELGGRVLAALKETLPSLHQIEIVPKTAPMQLFTANEVERKINEDVNAFPVSLDTVTFTADHDIVAQASAKRVRSAAKDSERRIPSSKAPSAACGVRGSTKGGHVMQSPSTSRPIKVPAQQRKMMTASVLPQIADPHTVEQTMCREKEIDAQFTALYDKLNTAIDVLDELDTCRTTMVASVDKLISESQARETEHISRSFKDVQ